MTNLTVTTEIKKKKIEVAIRICFSPECESGRSKCVNDERGAKIPGAGLPWRLIVYGGAYA